MIRLEQSYKNLAFATFTLLLIIFYTSCGRYSLFHCKNNVRDDSMLIRADHEPARLPFSVMAP